MNLKALIASVTAEPPGKEAEKELIFLCRNIALVCVRRRSASGRLDLGMFGVSAEDLALDCVADLFQRDQSDRLVQIVAYFGSFPVVDSTDEELLSHLRRLVFARVNQSLFTLYNEIDPSLGKIIRNIKLAVSSLRTFQIVERLGESCLVPMECDAQEHLPPMDRDEIASSIRQLASRSRNIPEVLAKLCHEIREQGEYSRMVPLMAVAFAIRSSYAPEADPRGGAVGPEDQFTAADAEKVIDAVCAEVKNSMRQQYVGRKNVEPAMYENYFGVICEYVAEHIVHQEGDLPSFYERLRSKVPSLTREEYRAVHKSRLEYLEKLVTERVLDELRKGV